MKPQELVNIGIPHDCLGIALETAKKAFATKLFKSGKDALIQFKPVAESPALYTSHEVFGRLAEDICNSRQKTLNEQALYSNNPHGKPAKWHQWGTVDDLTRQQMELALDLPVAVAGATMPDSHPGYGICIGGVLGTYDSVIPYAVGVDIACRMKLSVLDIPSSRLDDVYDKKADSLIRALTGGSVFGVGGRHKVKQDHEVMDRDWTVSPTTREMKDRAWTQLGSSGSGNHFVEFGLLTLEQPDLGLEPGTYVALMSHSGSRGTGAAVCKTYSDIAKGKLPKAYERFANLAWLPMSSEAGQEYWAAMNLMGEYASANHAIIHKLVSELAGGQIIAGVENHHNFAWLEEHGGKKLYVHRKGATPAGEGVLGVIPGSMADPAFVVRGKGKPESLMSASHGAGRQLSRTQAIKNFNWADWKSIIKQRGVRLLSAGLDEVPGAYKPILEVMHAQTDLVDIVARFDPKIVRMSDDGRSED